MASMLLTTANLKLTLLLAAAVAVTGCATAPQQPAAAAPVAVEPRRAEPHGGGAIAELARNLVGSQYHYGGAKPDEGFDCSGLVFYTYGKAGYRVPRTSQELFRAARKIALGEAGAGDLMFFQDEAKLSHVGIYLGNGWFVHAPASGQKVAVANLDSAYYQQHLVAVGRLLPPERRLTRHASSAARLSRTVRSHVGALRAAADRCRRLNRRSSRRAVASSFNAAHASCNDCSDAVTPAGTSLAPSRAKANWSATRFCSLNTRST
jgi:hypothetical protein